MSNYYQQWQPTQPTFTPIQNPFAPKSANDIDPEYEAQIAQQQSIYSAANPEYQKLKNAEKWSIPNPSTTSTAKSKDARNLGSVAPEKKVTVVREAGGQVWDDQTLLEWDPSHFRLFVGDLAGEVTDDTLFKAFKHYSTLTKARVIRDKRTTKSKGYGFVAFSDSGDFLKAWREMQGKYIGSHPIKLRKAETQIKAKVVSEKGLEVKKRWSPYERAKGEGGVREEKNNKKNKGNWKGKRTQ